MGSYITAETAIAQEKLISSANEPPSVSVSIINLPVQFLG